MNFLLDKTEHQEMPHPRVNSQGNLLQTQAVHSAAMENQSMWRCQMSTVLQQSSQNSSQTGKHITLCKYCDISHR